MNVNKTANEAYPLDIEINEANNKKFDVYDRLLKRLVGTIEKKDRELPRYSATVIKRGVADEEIARYNNFNSALRYIERMHTECIYNEQDEDLDKFLEIMEEKIDALSCRELLCDMSPRKRTMIIRSHLIEIKKSVDRVLCSMGVDSQELQFEGLFNSNSKDRGLESNV